MAPGTEQPPMDQNSGGEHVPPTSEQKSSEPGYDKAERGPFGRVLDVLRRRRREAIAGATGTVALAAAFLTGGAINGDNDRAYEAPQPIATKSALPTPESPSPTPIPSLTPEVSAPPKTVEKDDSAELQGYLDRETVDFNKLSRKQRSEAVGYAYYNMYTNLLYEEGLHLEIEPAQEALGKPAVHMWDLNTLSKKHGAHLKNTGDEIVRIAAYNENAAYIAYADKSDPTGLRNLDMSRNLVSGASYYTSQDNHPEETKYTYDRIANKVEKLDETFLLNKAEIPRVVDTGPLTKGVDLEGNPITYRDILQTVKDKAYLVRYVYDSVEIKVSDIDGVVSELTVNNWLPLSSTPQELTVPK